MLSTEFSAVTDGQEVLIAYWQACRDENGIVRREQLNAGDLRALLAGLSIVELGPDGEARFRLAGSRLCQEFGQELRGHCLNDVAGETRDAFLAGLAHALEHQGPVGGTKRSSRGGAVHAWLRLPLASDDTCYSRVLCLDEFLPARAVRGGGSIPRIDMHHAA